MTLLVLVVIGARKINLIVFKIDFISFHSYMDHSKQVQTCLFKEWLELPIFRDSLSIIVKPVMNLIMYSAMVVIDVCLNVKMVLMIRWRRENSSHTAATARNIRVLRSVFIMTMIYTMLVLTVVFVDIYFNSL